MATPCTQELMLSSSGNHACSPNEPQFNSTAERAVCRSTSSLRLKRCDPDQCRTSLQHEILDDGTLNGMPALLGYWHMTSISPSGKLSLECYLPQS
jgi:hypothetical protein